MSLSTSELASIVSDSGDSVTVEPDSPQVRRQIALAAAERCKQVLVQEFQATEVIVFGSLRGDTPWHDRSDLDLAVRGISRDLILRGISAVGERCP